MNLSQHAPTPTRYLGIGLVAALHLAGIYALSAGLIKPPPRPPSLTTVKTLPPDRPEPPPPIPRLQAEQPKLSQPLPTQVEPLVDVVMAPDPVITSVPPSAATPTIPSAAPAYTAQAAPAQPSGQLQMQAPGAVCSTMPRPEVPMVNWSGDAVFQVLATVRGGRVVGSEFRSVQGALDSKTRRALQRSVETALASYQCQGDAVFQQDFAFHLD